MRIGLALFIAGCGRGGEGEPTGTSTGPTTLDDTGGDPAQLCVDTINKYRGLQHLTPYERWTEAETCVDGQARDDSRTGQAHGAFGDCAESAQNECPDWPAPPSGMIEDCLAMMWAEGPGDFAAHGHYINMSSKDYTEVACGYHVSPDGTLWATQDFR